MAGTVGSAHVGQKVVRKVGDIDCPVVIKVTYFPGVSRSRETAEKILKIRYIDSSIAIRVAFEGLKRAQGDIGRRGHVIENPAIHMATD